MPKSKGTFNTNQDDTDLYLRRDAKGQAEYNRYMSKRSVLDIGKTGKKYYEAEAEKHEASDKGHTDATAKTVAELAKRLAARDRAKGWKNQGK